MGVAPSLYQEGYEYVTNTDELALEESCFKDFPVDIFFEILTLLSVQDIIHIGFVCKYWRSLHKENYVWGLLYKKKFPWDKTLINKYFDAYNNRMLKKIEVAKQAFNKLEKVFQHENMKYIFNLEIKDHRVMDIPQAISVPPIISLSIIYSQIYKFPIVLTSLENLRELNMGYNKLKKIPPEISRLMNLTKLQLNNNKLTELPPEIGSLNKLLELDIFNNKLTSIPSEIGNLTRLETLSVQCNALTIIPNELNQLEHLRLANFSQNKIEEVPEDLSALTNLQKLLLSNNKIKKIPESLLDLTGILELNFFDNPIEVKLNKMKDALIF